MLGYAVGIERSNHIFDMVTHLSDSLSEVAAVKGKSPKYVILKFTRAGSEILARWNGKRSRWVHV